MTSNPPAEQLARLALDYPLTTARLLIDAVVSPVPRGAPALARWEALVAAHGPVEASAYLRRACAFDHLPQPESVVGWAKLEGYVADAAA